MLNRFQIDRFDLVWLGLIVSYCLISTFHSNLVEEQVVHRLVEGLVLDLLELRKNVNDLGFAPKRDSLWFHEFKNELEGNFKYCKENG